MPAKRTRAQTKKFLELARARFKLGTESGDVNEQRKRIKEDLIFMSDQWPSEVRVARSGQLANNGLPPLPARPCLQIDKISYPIRQVLNEERQADLSPKVVPADDFAGLIGPIDDTEIELREGLLRKILRESEAADGFSWAFSRAVVAGEGFFAVRTRYLPGATFDQEVYFERIYDQSSVVLDPNRTQPDGSDADWSFEGGTIPKEQYEAEYPHLADGKRNPSVGLNADEFRAQGSTAPGWFTTDGDVQYVRVMNHWWTDYIRHTYVQLADGRTIDQSDMTDADQPMRDEDGQPMTRDWVERKICAAKIDGVNILEETEFPARWQPIVQVLGEELHPADGKRWVQGIVRPARDSQMGFNAMVSSQVERVAVAPLPPIQLAEGQDEGFEEEYKVANTRNLPVLHYRQRDLEGNPAPPPARVNSESNIQAISQSVALFDQAIKSTTGVPDPTLGNVDPSLRSGNAVKALVAQSQRGTSNFMDNLIRSQRHAVRIANDLFPAIYNRPGRMVQIMTGESNKLKTIQLHMAANGGKPYTFTKGADFNISISVVKNADTRRQEENALIGELISEDPQGMLPIIGDLYFETMDSPGAKEMAARFKAVLNPAVAAIANGQQPIPPQAQQQIQQLGQQNEQLTQHLNAAIEKIQTKQVEKHADIIRAANDNATRLEIAKIQAGATLGVADVKASTDQILASVRAESEQLRMVIETAKEERLQLKDHMHEAVMQGVEHGQERVAAEHEAALEQATNAHQTGLDMALASHQAAVAPQPTPDDGGSGADDNAG